MIDFRQAKFLKSSVDRKSFLKDRNMVVLIGKSNAGKSTLVNTICDNKKLMKVSKEPGRTRQMNYLDIIGKYYIVDAPGYGYAGSLDFMEMLADFFDYARGKVKAIYLLLDPLRELKNDDFDLFEMAKSYDLTIKIVFAKSDKLNATLRRKAMQVKDKVFTNHEVFFVSSKTKEGIDELRKDLSLVLN